MQIYLSTNLHKLATRVYNGIDLEEHRPMEDYKLPEWLNTELSRRGWYDRDFARASESVLGRGNGFTVSALSKILNRDNRPRDDLKVKMAATLAARPYPGGPRDLKTYFALMQQAIGLPVYIPPVTSVEAQREAERAARLDAERAEKLTQLLQASADDAELASRLQGIDPEILGAFLDQLGPTDAPGVETGAGRRRAVLARRKAAQPPHEERRSGGR
jgi:hypothetical protein